MKIECIECHKAVDEDDAILKQKKQISPASGWVSTNKCFVCKECWDKEQKGKKK